MTARRAISSSVVPASSSRSRVRVAHERRLADGELDALEEL
jgi:hypothetical protein